MEKEAVTIFKVGTDQAIKSVGDLRENIRLLKEQLNQTSGALDKDGKEIEYLTIGTAEYNAKVKELSENEAALRNAMNGTTASMTDVQKAAKGVGTTYNSLVQQMKSLKQTIRNVDVSTDEGKQKFAELAEQINSVNNQLKGMDADMGNYQRNVGNYNFALQDLGDITKNMPSFMGKAKQAGEDLNKTMKLMAGNPILAIGMLIAPILKKIIDKLKENETAMAAIKKAMDALKPVFDIVEQVIQKLAEWLSKAVDWFVKMASESGGTFKKIIAGAVGVGNALLQYLLTPIRSAVEAFKGMGQIIKDVFTGNWADVKQHAEDTFKGIGEAFKKGFSFKENYNKGKEVANQFIDGIDFGKNKAKKSGEGIGKAVGEGIKVGLSEEIEMLDDTLDAIAKKAKQVSDERKAAAESDLKHIEDITKQRLKWNQLQEEDEAKRAENAYEIQKAANEQRLALLKKSFEDAELREDWDAAAQWYKQMEDLKVEMAMNAYERQNEIRKKDVEAEKKSAEQKKSLVSAYGSAVQNVLGTIADIYEQAGEEDEAAAQKAKAVRIAEAVISTIMGALQAYNTAQSLGPIAGPIVGAVNAAAVTAAGIANIAKIKATKIGSGDSAGSGVQTPSPVVAAPATTVDVPEVHNLTTQTDVETMKEAAADQKVYILNSDLEANADYHKTQVEEATF